MLHVLANDPLQNQQLAALPIDSYQLLKASLAVGSHPVGTTLVADGAYFQDVYFPLAGMISLVMELKDGKGVETATVGREGVVGAMAALGFQKSYVRVTVQLPLTCAKVRVQVLAILAEQCEPIRNLCLRYNENLLTQARTCAACNAHHLIEARFCRSILQISDRCDEKDIPLTQEYLAEMLGVRRTSVTEVAHKFKAAGAIGYSRGHIEIRNREALKAAACECYENLRSTGQEIASAKIGSEAGTRCSRNESSTERNDIVRPILPHSSCKTRIQDAATPAKGHA